MYNVLLILLHRPFVADGHLYTTSRSLSVNSFLVCATAASHIVYLARVYDRAFSIRRAPYLMSYATYVNTTIHVRIAAKRGAGSEAHASLETCLGVFRENQETNSAVRRANIIIVNLMKRLGVTLPERRDGFQIRARHTTERDAVQEPERSEGGEADTHMDTSSVQEEAPRDHISPNLDIDAVIQSFAREQQEGNLLPNKGAMNNNFPEMGIDYSASRSTYNDQSAQPTYYDSSANFYPDGNTDWQSSLNLPPQTIDDLLFGLNGTALDGYYIPNWE
jgi:hypothetical protein